MLPAALILLLAWTCASDVVDVTTLYNISTPSKIKCSARTNARGLSFINPNGEFEDPQLDDQVPSCHVEHNEPCEWQSQGWSVIPSGSLHHLPPFSELQEWRFVTDGVNVSEIIPLAQPYLQFRLRVSREGAARILLLEEDDLVDSHMIVVNVMDENRDSNAVLRCDDGAADPSQPVNSRKCTPIGDHHIHWDEDKEITFRMELFGGYLQLWRQDTAEHLVVSVHLDRFRYNYFAAVTQGVTRNWTIILEPKTLVLRESGGVLSSPMFRSMSHNLCLSFFYYLDNAPECYLEVFVRINNVTQDTMRMINKGTSTGGKAWRMQRLAMTLEGSAVVQFVIQGFKDNLTSSISVHGIMACNVEEKEETAVMELGESQFICSMAQGPSSPVTDVNCTGCANGGVCDSITQTCACPAGFMGHGCEDGCGENRYGRDCNGQCSASGGDCKGLTLCTQLTGCMCAPGYHGPYCNQSCSLGRYGGDCKQECGQCRYNCDIFSGRCVDGCLDGFYPPYCKDTYSYLREPPHIMNVSFCSAVAAFSTLHEDLGGRGEPAYYQVQYLGAKNVWYVEPARAIRPGDRVVHQLSDLSPGVSYKLRVVLIDGDGSYFCNESRIPMTNFITMCNVSVDPVYNLSIAWIGQYAFAAEWKYETNASQDCPSLYFNIYIKENSSSYYFYSTTEALDAIIDEMDANTEYMVKVEAVTREGTAPASPEIVIKTKKAVPSNVAELYYVQVSSTELNITWVPPQTNTGVSIRYMVKYKCLQYMACPNETCDDSFGNMTTSETSVLLGGLLPYAQYEVFVSIFTVDVQPDFFTRITAYTGCSAPGAAPLPSPHSILYKGPTFISATWTSLEDCRQLHGSPIGFMYSLYRTSAKLKLLVSVGNITRPPVTFSGLLPGQDYEIHVRQLVTGGLYNDTQYLNITGRTTEVDSPYVRNIQVTAALPTQVEISWQYPYIASRNMLPRFNIRYKCLEILACGHKGNCSEENSTWALTSNVLISGLRPYTAYAVEIAPYINRMGMFVSTVVTTAISVAETVPMMATTPVTTVGRTWAVLQWKSPRDCTRFNGILVGFGLRLKVRGTLFMERKINVTSTQINVTELVPSTHYDVEVCLLTGTSDNTLELVSKHFLQFSFMTRSAPPGPVSKLTVYRRALNQLGVRYVMPHYPYGILDGVTIFCEPLGGESVQLRTKAIDCEHWPGFMCVEVKDLMPNTNYTLKLRVWNSDLREEGAAESVTGFTQEEAPGPPSFLRLLTRSNSSLTVQWGVPSMLNGFLRTSRVEYRQVHSSNSRRCCESSKVLLLDVREERNSYDVKLSDLRAASTYSVSVSTSTTLDGPAVLANVSTLPPTPVFKVGAVPVVSSTTQHTVTVMLKPANINNEGYISAYYVVVHPLTSSHNNKWTTRVAMPPVNPSRDDLDTGVEGPDSDLAPDEIRDTRIETSNVKSSHDDLRAARVSTSLVHPSHNDTRAVKLEMELRGVIEATAFVELKLSARELGYGHRVTVGDLVPLQPASSYRVELLAASEYEDGRVFGRVSSAPFNTDREEENWHHHRN